MLVNIVDCRQNQYKTIDLYGAVEPASHDKSIEGSTKYEFEPGGVIIEFMGPLSFSELLQAAECFAGKNTLFVYETDPRTVVVTKKYVDDNVGC